MVKLIRKQSKRLTQPTPEFALLQNISVREKIYPVFNCFVCEFGNRDVVFLADGFNGDALGCCEFKTGVDGFGFGLWGLTKDVDIFNCISGKVEIHLRPLWFGFAGECAFFRKIVHSINP